ncbi:MAG TPA: thiamine-phosphate kinase [Alphaproteobacteria bacterium]
MDEFGLIARFFAPLARGEPGAMGLTDDAAVLALTPGERLVATADGLVAGIHFPADDPPGDIARKLVRVNLSDLAAMGARPRALLLVAVFPRTVAEEWLAAFAEGLGRDIEAFDVPLAGGDTIAGDGPLTLALTALGEAAPDRILTRGGARAGDAVYVSGTIGDGTLGLMALRGELDSLQSDAREAVIMRYRLPQPRLSLGRALAGTASACIDVSDGLIADLGHLCECSRLGARIEAAAVPHSPAVRAALDADPGLRARLLGGGDDYELLFTAAPAREAEIVAAAREGGVPVRRIGTMVAGSGVEITDADALGLDVASPGFRHF